MKKIRKNTAMNRSSTIGMAIDFIYQWHNGENSGQLVNVDDKQTTDIEKNDTCPQLQISQKTYQYQHKIK